MREQEWSELLASATSYFAGEAEGVDADSADWEECGDPDAPLWAILVLGMVVSAIWSHLATKPSTPSMVAKLSEPLHIAAKPHESPPVVKHKPPENRSKTVKPPEQPRRLPKDQSQPTYVAFAPLIARYEQKIARYEEEERIRLQAETIARDNDRSELEQRLDRIEQQAYSKDTAHPWQPGLVRLPKGAGSRPMGDRERAEAKALLAREEMLRENRKRYEERKQARERDKQEKQALLAARSYQNRKAASARINSKRSANASAMNSQFRTLVSRGL